MKVKGTKESDDNAAATMRIRLARALLRLTRIDGANYEKVKGEFDDALWLKRCRMEVLLRGRVPPDDDTGLASEMLGDSTGSSRTPSGEYIGHKGGAHTTGTTQGQAKADREGSARERRSARMGRKGHAQDASWTRSGARRAKSDTRGRRGWTSGATRLSFATSTRWATKKGGAAQGARQRQ